VHGGLDAGVRLHLECPTVTEPAGLTKIVFTGGAEVTVAAEAHEVRRLLSEDVAGEGGGDAFTHFKTAGRDAVDVYVAAGEVAYIQQAIERTGFASF
jgi:hypothetical protein